MNTAPPPGRSASSMRPRCSVTISWEMDSPSPVPWPTPQGRTFLDRELWEHFGSEERVLEALRLLIELAQRRSA